MKKVKRYGLGGSIGTAAGLALNFIPGVGPIASAIATPLLSAAGDAIEKKIEDNKVKPNNLTPVGQLPDMTGNTQMFRNGGKPQLRTISGPKHENGGVPLRDKNGRVIGEVEGGETKVVKNGQPEFIFSDSIVVPNTNQTFADMSKQIKNNKQGLKALASMQERVKGVPTSGPMFKDGGAPELFKRGELYRHTSYLAGLQEDMHKTAAYKRMGPDAVSREDKAKKPLVTKPVVGHNKDFYNTPAYKQYQETAIKNQQKLPTTIGPNIYTNKVDAAITEAAERKYWDTIEKAKKDIEAGKQARRQSEFNIENDKNVDRMRWAGSEQQVEWDNRQKAFDSYNKLNADRMRWAASEQAHERDLATKRAEASERAELHKERDRKPTSPAKGPVIPRESSSVDMFDVHKQRDRKPIKPTRDSSSVPTSKVGGVSTSDRARWAASEAAVEAEWAAKRKTSSTKPAIPVREKFVPVTPMESAPMPNQLSGGVREQGVIQRGPEFKDRGVPEWFGVRNPEEFKYGGKPMYQDGGKPRLVTREEYLANKRPTIFDKIDNAVGSAFTNDPYKRDWWEGTEVKLKKPVAPVRDTNQSLRTIAPNPTLQLTQRQSTRPATQQPVATTAPAGTTVPATSPTAASGSTRKPASSSSGSSSYGETRFNALSAGPVTPMPSRTPSTGSEMNIMGKKEITPELAAGLKPSASPSGRMGMVGGMAGATAIQTALPLIGGAINLRSFSKDMMPDLKENAGFTAARALMPDRFSLDAARTDVKQSERNANAMIGRNVGSASSMMAYSLANRNRSNSAYNQIAQQEEQGNNALKMAKAELELKAGADKQAVQNQLSMLDAQRRQNRILSITDALMGAASNYYAGQYDAESLRLTDKTARPGVTGFIGKKFGGKVKRY